MVPYSYPGGRVGGANGLSPLSEQEENSKDKEAEEKKRKEEEEKSKKRKASLKRLFALALPEWFNLTLAMIALLLNSATTLVVPLVLGAVVGALDPSSGDNAMTQLNQSVVFLVILFAVGSVFAFIRAWLFTLVGQRIVARLRTSLFDAVISQEVAFFDKVFFLFFQIMLAFIFVYFFNLKDANGRNHQPPDL